MIVDPITLNEATIYVAELVQPILEEALPIYIYTNAFINRLHGDEETSGFDLMTKLAFTIVANIPNPNERTVSEPTHLHDKYDTVNLRSLIFPKDLDLAASNSSERLKIKQDKIIMEIARFLGWYDVRSFGDQLLFIANVQLNRPAI